MCALSAEHKKCCCFGLWRNQTVNVLRIATVLALQEPRECRFAAAEMTVTARFVRDGQRQRPSGVEVGTINIQL